MIQHQGVWLPDGEVHLVEWMTKDGEIVDGKGTYQIKKLRAALQHVKQFRVAVDIGAHCGMWSMQLAKRFGRLHAFEPVAKNRDCFLKNLEGCENVQLNAGALGGRTGYVSIETKPDSSAASRVAAYAEFADHPIPLHTLDSFEFQVIDFIKIDTEGYELFVVQGAEQTVKRCRPTIIIEQKGHGMEYFGFRKEEALELLESWGMKRIANMTGDWIMGWE